MIESMIFERTPAFGPSPVYRISVDRDGLVQWEGSYFVHRVGDHLWKISPQKMRCLYEAFMAADFFAIERRQVHEDAYDVTDCPGCVITLILTNGRRRTITHDHGESGWPPALVRLEAAIDQILGTSKYVKIPKHPLDEASLLPSRLEVSIGGFGGPWYSIEWTNGELQYRQGMDGEEVFLRLWPLPEDWQRFWADLDKLDAWQWEKRYHNDEVLDGTSWDAEIKYGKKRVASGGCNAYPGSPGPDPGKTFTAFCRSIQKLIGGFEFR